MFRAKSLQSLSIYVCCRGTQPRSLFRRFRLELVTSSHACERNIAETPKTANQVFNESDAMAASYDAAEVSCLMACGT